MFIYHLVGLGLVILGGVSGVSLFFRAVVGKDKVSEGPGMGTLWGLFIGGIVGGLIIMSFR